MHKQLHPTTVAIPVTMDDKFVHAGSAMQHAPFWYYQNSGTTKSNFLVLPKVVLTSCALPCVCQAAFARQVYLLTRLNHPNLVRCVSSWSCLQTILRLMA
jgi:hypothetical protein